MNEHASIPLRRTCGVMEVERRLTRTHKPYVENRAKINYQAADQYLRVSARHGPAPVLTIPVIVHVVYNTPAQNVRLGQIRSQIAVLNRDFRRLNADRRLVPAGFVPLVADARVHFKLAARDPEGRATNGITRTKTAVQLFSDQDDGVKFASSGGHDAWPWNCYLNLWVCPLGGGLLGYAQFPGGPASTDGVVINYQAFGTSGTATAPFNRGRTATHEVGHWLNLFHIWGDDDACDATDEVADTPNQATENTGCPVYPHITCGNGPRGDMFMNYMDYTDDACMFMFSKGQAVRMTAALNGPRADLRVCGARNLRLVPRRGRAGKKVTKSAKRRSPQPRSSSAGRTRGKKTRTR